MIPSTRHHLQGWWHLLPKSFTIPIQPSERRGKAGLTRVWLVVSLSLLSWGEEAGQNRYRMTSLVHNTGTPRVLTSYTTTLRDANDLAYGAAADWWAHLAGRTTRRLGRLFVFPLSPSPAHHQHTNPRVRITSRSESSVEPERRTPPNQHTSTHSPPPSQARLEHPPPWGKY